MPPSLLVILVLLAGNTASFLPHPKRDYWPTDEWRRADPAKHGFNTSLLNEAVTFTKDFNMGGGEQKANGSWVCCLYATRLPN